MSSSSRNKIFNTNDTPTLVPNGKPKVLAPAVPGAMAVAAAACVKGFSVTASNNLMPSDFPNGDCANTPFENMSPPLLTERTEREVMAVAAPLLM